MEDFDLWEKMMEFEDERIGEGVGVLRVEKLGFMVVFWIILRNFEGWWECLGGWGNECGGNGIWFGECEGGFWQMVESGG